MMLLLIAGAGCDQAAVKRPPAVEEPMGPSTVRAPDAAAVDVAPADAEFHIPPAGAVDARPPDLAGCTSLPDEDNDHDGYTVAQGDCNDCDKQVNPGAYDVAGNKVDEDCSGKVDDEPMGCDQGLALDGDAASAAKALGICRTAMAGAPAGKTRSWGLLKAAYVFPDGTTAAIKAGDQDCGRVGDPPNPRSHGILPAFGSALKPRQGTSMVALSSGIARQGVVTTLKGDISPEGAPMCTRSLTPEGFPVSAYATCGDLAAADGKTNANDAIALELTLRAPSNASSLSFDFDFHTFEYSMYVCSDYNDAFVALLYSKAPDVPANHNIAFDSQKNPVSVNNGFVEVCTPYTYEGKMAGKPFTRQFPCGLGTSELEGTGFEDHAATGWLETRTNVVPGEELTLRFAIWDAGDEALDSTVLIDNLKWDVKAGTTVTMRPPPIE